MNNAGTPANKRRHPLTPFHGAAPYARVPRAFKLPPSAPVWKKKEKREKEKQMTAESNINKPEAARKSKRRMRGGVAVERRKSSGKTRHLSLTPPLQRSADKYRGQGTGKIISLRRQEEEKRGNQAEDWDDERCRDAFFIIIFFSISLLGLSCAEPFVALLPLPVMLSCVCSDF